MIRINLLPVKEAKRAFGRRQEMALAVLSGLIVVLVLLIPYLMQGRTLARLDGEIESLGSEIAKLNQQAAEVRDLERKRKDLEAKLRVIGDLTRKRVGPVHMLADLSDAAPEKLWLVDFTDADGAAMITGMALDNQTIATFMRHLQASKYFYEVDLVETSQSDPLRTGTAGGTGMAFKRFIIKARLDYLGNAGKPVANPGAPEAEPAPPGAKAGA